MILKFENVTNHHLTQIFQEKRFFELNYILYFVSNKIIERN